MQAQTALAPARVQQADATQPAEGRFASVLKTAINEVNGAQHNARDLQKSFAMGDPTVALPRVILAGAPPHVQLKAMTEVPTPLVAAYQDPLNMPLHPTSVLQGTTVPRRVPLAGPPTPH